MTACPKGSYPFRRDFQRMICPWNRKARKELQFISFSTFWTLILYRGVVRSGSGSEVLDEAPVMYWPFVFRLSTGAFKEMQGFL